MEENKVTLEFPENFTSLTGFDYGKEIYNTQVSGKVEVSKPFFMVLPDRIELITSSFIEGLLEDIINTFGYKKTLTLANFIHPDENIANSIKNKL